MYGKKSVGVIRSTFVIGADGTVARAHYGVKATGHVDRLLRDLIRGKVTSQAGRAGVAK